MESQKIYLAGNSGNGGGSGTDMTALVTSLLNSNGLNSNWLLPMLMMNGGGLGYGGGGFIWLLFLLAFMRGGFGGWGGNGNGCDNNGWIASMFNNDSARDFFMQAIQGNRSAIDNLSTQLGCKAGDIANLIQGLSTQLCQFTGQTGANFQQVINAIDRGDANLAAQLASCCCDLKGAIKDVTIGQERGFSSLAFETQKQTCSIEKAIESSTSRILEGQRAAEMRELNRDIAERDRKIAEQGVIINNAQQTQVFGQMIAQATTPILGAVQNLQSDVDGIKCKLPKTDTVIAQPQYIPVNTGVNVGLQPYLAGGCALGFNNGYGYGWNGGSLWG